MAVCKFLNLQPRVNTILGSPNLKIHLPDLERVCASEGSWVGCSLSSQLPHCSRYFYMDSGLIVYPFYLFLHLLLDCISIIFSLFFNKTYLTKLFIIWKYIFTDIEPIWELQLKRKYKQCIFRTENINNTVSNFECVYGVAWSQSTISAFIGELIY